jgi:cell division protein FtsQ
VNTGQVRSPAPDTDAGNAAVPASPSRPGAAAPGTGRRQDQLKRPAGRRRTAFFGVLVLVILAGVSWALLGSSLLAVRHIQVTGNRLVTAAEVRRAAAIRTGTPLATVNTAAALRRVDRIPAVLSATVRRSWPDTIIITVRERTPVLAVASARGYQLIDAHGVTVRWAARKPASMPLLSGPPAVLRGSPAVGAVAAVLGDLPRSLRRRIASLSATSASTVTLHLAGGITVLWGGASDPGEKLAELGLLLRKHARYYDISDPSTAVTGG